MASWLQKNFSGNKSRALNEKMMKWVFKLQRKIAIESKDYHLQYANTPPPTNVHVVKGTLMQV